MMNSEKQKFLKSFYNFLSSFTTLDYGKCYFRLVSGQECQGWIIEINEFTFVYMDSGPLSKDEPYIFDISDIDVESFTYWDDEIKKWTEYFVPDKLENRQKARK